MSNLAPRLALATAGATFVLILVGGLVTNTGAALAVPDWPTTFGYNMFLYPWSRMAGGILYEHSHRLLGALAGILTLGLAVALWPAGRLQRALGLLAVAVVVVQGVLGGLRVLLRADTLALVHGSFAQAFFALSVVIALLVSPQLAPAWRMAPAVEPPLRALTMAAAALVYIQIVSGALLTHFGRTDLHLAGAAAVFALLPILTARFRRTGDRVDLTLSRMLLGLLGVQLVLGIGSFLARFSSIALPAGGITVIALPVAHRLTGSLILALTVTLAVRVTLAGTRDGWRRRSSDLSPAPSSAGFARAKQGVSGALGAPDADRGIAS